VLTIFLAGWRSEEESPWFYEGTTAELFRTVRVIGSQVVFVEPSPGHLINVAHIERIAEDQSDELDATAREAQRVLDEYDAEQPDELPALLQHRGRQRARRAALPGEAASEDLLEREGCSHGFIMGTCEQCSENDALAAP
jgi:hypothetical protein